VGDGSAGSPAGMTTVTVAVLALAVTYGLVCGAMMLAGEHEAGTQVFLDALTGRRGGVWLAKVLAGVPLAAAQACVGAGVAVYLGLISLEEPVRSGAAPVGWNWYWILPLATLEAYV